MTVPAEPIAVFKDLCIDAVDRERAAQFWSAALGLQVERADDELKLTGPTPAHTVWLNEVPEPKTGKNRIHLDVHTGSLAELKALGARILEPDGGRGWTVMTDPDGQEFCAFVRSSPPDYRLYELVIDAADGRSIAAWWLRVLGGRLEPDGQDCALLEIAGLPFESLVFGTVPEPKAGKNRVHWDVTGDPEELVEAGATLLRPRGGDLGWHVLADPEGNEFCVFEATAGGAETTGG